LTQQIVVVHDGYDVPYNRGVQDVRVLITENDSISMAEIVSEIVIAETFKVDGIPMIEPSGEQIIKVIASKNDFYYYLIFGTKESVISREGSYRVLLQGENLIIKLDGCYGKTLVGLKDKAELYGEIRSEKVKGEIIKILLNGVINNG
jgi:hypothetical protein